MSEPVFYSENPLDDFIVEELKHQLDNLEEGNRRLIYEYLAGQFLVRPIPTNKKRKIVAAKLIPCPDCEVKKKHFWQHCHICNDTGQVFE